MTAKSLAAIPRRDLLQCAVALLGVTVLPAVRAQGAAGYPNKPVRVLLGYPPGGTADVMTRLIAEILGRALKQTFYVENKPGASGNIATRMAAQSAPDGYNILFGNPAEMVINKFVSKDMGFDPDADFVPVVRVFNVPLALVVPANAPYRTLAELVADAKKRPQQVTFASAGSGSPGHLAAEALAFHANAPMTHVPYKGAGPALNDIIGGHVGCYFAGLTAVVQHVQAGAIRVLAVSSAKRSQLMPDVPTVNELLGFNDFDYTLWGGLFVHKGTPPEIVRTLNRVVNDAYARPDVQARMAKEYNEATPHTPEEFGAFVKSQSAKYQAIIKAIGYTGS